MLKPVPAWRIRLVSLLGDVYVWLSDRLMPIDPDLQLRVRRAGYEALAEYRGLAPRDNGPDGPDDEPEDGYKRFEPPANLHAAVLDAFDDRAAPGTPAFRTAAARAAQPRQLDLGRWGTFTPLYVPCDGAHAAPACPDPQCWRSEP